MLLASVEIFHLHVADSVIHSCGKTEGGPELRIFWGGDAAYPPTHGRVKKLT